MKCFYNLPLIKINVTLFFSIFAPEYQAHGTGQFEKSECTFRIGDPHYSIPKV